MLTASNSNEVYILLYFKFKYRKSRTIKEDTMFKLICATNCSNNHKHPQIHSQDSLYFTITLAVLRGMALSYLKGGTDALESRHKEVSAHADFPGWLETY